MFDSTQNCFYFIKDKYFTDFTDPYLLTNKQEGNRPCFYSFLDKKTNLYWFIPISSQVPKYQAIYNYKIAKYGKCDTILFENVLGKRRAFLIQNMFPATKEYVDKVYENNSVPVNIPNNFKEELEKKSKRVLGKVRRGIKLIFPDVLSIEKQLKK